MSLGDLPAKWAAFGWEVLQLENGTDVQAVIDVLGEARSHTGKGKAVVILMRTEMGFGVDFMVGTHVWHGKTTNAEQTERALGQLEETLGDF